MGRAAVQGEGSVAMAGNSSSASGCGGGGGEGVRLRCCQGLHPLPAHPHSGRTWTDARWKCTEEGSRGCTRREAMVRSYSRRGWSGRASGRGGWRPSLDRENWVKEKAEKKWEKRREFCSRAQQGGIDVSYNIFSFWSAHADFKYIYSSSTRVYVCV